MAIVKMKRLRVLALEGDREAILARLLHVGCVEISEPQEQLSDPAWTDLLRRGESTLADQRQRLTQVEAALQTLDRYAPAKTGMFRKRKQIQETDFFSPEALELALSNAEAINERERRIAELRGQEDRLAARRASLQPWAALDVDLAIASTKHVKIALAVCPAGVELSLLMADLTAAAPTAQVVEASCDKEQHYFLYLCHVSEAEAAAEALKPYGVSPAGLKGFTGTAIDNIAAIDRESEGLTAQRAALEEEVRTLSPCRQDLQICTDRLKQDVSKQESAQHALTDGTIFFFTGWVTEPGLPAVSAELDKFPCAWETEDPAPEDYPEVPVKLQNGPLVRPLNMVTEMYSLPAYDGIDPNPLMAPFFILFYGMMMADMGYGLIMMLVSVWALLRLKPKGPTMRYMTPLIGLCGASTFLWGALTGGFFGDLLPQMAMLLDPNTTFTAMPALFSPLDDAVPVLIGSLVLGLIQIFVGMGVSMYKQIQRGEKQAALCNEGAWFGVFALAGVGALGIVPLQVILAAIVILLVLTQGYGKKGIIAKVMAIGGSLYNNITGYFSDILSYSRLMALMLAGAVVAQVFNQLGAMTGNVVTFFLIAMIGNALNFALNLLGCYVHDMRLQCLEFFGRFYEDGGKPFRPLDVTTQYVDVVKE